MEGFGGATKLGDPGIRSHKGERTMRPGDFEDVEHSIIGGVKITGGGVTEC